MIAALETHFGRGQIFGDEVAFAKYCQKERLDERVNQVVADIIRKRELNCRGARKPRYIDENERNSKQ